MIHEHGDIVMVRVTEDAQDFKLNISSEDEWYVLEYLTQNLDEESGFYGEWGEADVELPPGSYTIVGLSSKLSEDEWRGIVESVKQGIGWTAGGHSKDRPHIILYMNYMIEKPVPVTFLFGTATASGLSLLKSKNLSPGTTLILKKQKI